MDTFQSKDEYVGAFQELYAFIYKTVLYIIKDENTAYDIVQDTFIKGYENAYTLLDKSKFKTWISRIAVNTAYTYMRRNKKITCKDIDEVAWIEKQIIQSIGENVEQKVLSLELESEVKKALAGLDQKHALILIYRFYCDMTYEDIAKEMNMKLNSVKVTLFRAKAQMKNELLKSDLIKEHVRSMKSDGR